jgi:hypothetical protein
MIERIMKTLSTACGMWCAVFGACFIGIVVIGLTSRLSVVTSRSLLDTPMVSWEHWLLMVSVVATASFLAAAPCIRFLSDGWKCRFDEFKNSIHGDAVGHYLGQFWATQLDQEPQAKTDPQAAEALFAKLYVRYNGRRDFVAPVLLLLAIAFILAVLVAQTGIDACIANRCLASAAPSPGRFAPLGDITLPPGSAAAIAGAYLFVVGDAILRARLCTMNMSDMYWYVLRLLLAVPMGLAFSETASPALASLVSFGLGAFPIDSLMKILRRLTNKSIGSTEETQETDEVVQLDGVTVPISAALAAEGINSIDELVGADPVLLSLRTGIPFPSILRFASQAVAWIHLDDRAGQLVRLGLGNAYLISQFIVELQSQRANAALAPKPADQRLADAVQVLNKDKTTPPVPSPASVEAAFKAISEHGYTKFLLSVT